MRPDQVVLNAACREYYIIEDGIRYEMPLYLAIQLRDQLKSHAIDPSLEVRSWIDKLPDLVKDEIKEVKLRPTS